MARNLYLIQQYPSNYFDYMINIGAHRGDLILEYFEKNPDTQIIGCEPDENNFAYLVENTNNIPNITVVNQALGDGSDLFLVKTKRWLDT